MKKKVKKYFEKLNPKQLGIEGTNVRVNSVSILGKGAFNMNYLVQTNGKKFVMRINTDLNDKKKSRNEFRILKIIEPLGLSPKPILLDESKKEFNNTLLIQTYIEGISLDKLRKRFTKRDLIEITKLIGKIQTIPLKNLKEIKKPIVDMKRWLKDIDKLQEYSLRNIKDTNSKKILKESYGKLKAELPKKFNFDPVFSQGDTNISNVIYNKGKYKLIDFEFAEIIDSSISVTGFLLDSSEQFTKEQKKIFFDNYFKQRKLSKRKKEELLSKIELIKPIFYYSIFIWGVDHIFKVKNKELDPRFQEPDKIEKSLKYLQYYFINAIKFGVIDKKYKNLDIPKLVGE